MNTMQQEFDAVVAHLYKQGKPALNKGGDCVYRGEGGTSCAVGCRIPDEMYKSSMDKASGGLGTSVSSLLLRKYALPLELREYSDMFTQLQRVHDDTQTDVEGNFCKFTLADNISKVALTHSLKFTIPQQ